MSRSITSVEGLIRKLSQKPADSSESLFYRGHSNRLKFRLQPSLYRNAGWRRNEQVMINELLSSNPSDFRDDRSMFEKLVRMQHHSLPTRLLDITSNPLMALYFACCEYPDAGGEVISFRTKKAKIKYSDSDTVSCISNVSRLTNKERAVIDMDLGKDAFNQEPPIKRLHHFIKEEKPYFTDIIVPNHLGKILCVIPKRSNLRIASQSGAFLLFGIEAELPEAGSAEIGIERVAISAAAKKKICSELEALNIHRGTVYPSIENSSMVIREQPDGVRPWGLGLIPSKSVKSG